MTLGSKISASRADTTAPFVSRRLISLAVFLVAVPWISPASADELLARVVAIADGDTITVLDSANRQHKIRLATIDAPERGQPFGTRCRDHLASTIYGQNVTVEWDKRDRYGRIVGQVFVFGRDTGLMQIEVGCAWHFKRYAEEQSEADQQEYSDAEKRARNAMRGLW